MGRPDAYPRMATKPPSQLEDMKTIDSPKRLLHTGECWRGCGAETETESFFLPGHDKAPESAVFPAAAYAGVPRLFVQKGYGSGAKNARHEVANWRAPNSG